MRRSIGLAIVVAITSMTPLLAATVAVQVGPGLSFSPSTITVAPGDTVVWTFFSAHTTSSDSSSGPEVWNSGLQSSGTFSHTFTTPGTYPYYCQLHSVPGGTAMNGSVQVAIVATPPSITSVSPTGALTGSTVTITGTGFVSGATVTFRGTASPTVTFINSTTLQAVVPNIVPGGATVVVTNPDTLFASFTGFQVISNAVPAFSATAFVLLGFALVFAAWLRLR